MRSHSYFFRNDKAFRPIQLAFVVKVFLSHASENHSKFEMSGDKKISKLIKYESQNLWNSLQKYNIIVKKKLMAQIYYM